MAKESESDNKAGHKLWSPWYILLLAPFVAVLWVPFYNSIEPAWMGIPFFYWYQFLWVVISSVITLVVYFATKKM
jgi:FtsH-binding integral membrane protein